MTGGNATVFIKQGDDFVRVATSVKKADGNRAVGTNLGNKHPAYATLMQGETFRGMAVLFGKPHVTEYVPIKDASGQVLGILYVGIDISSEVAALKTRIKSLKVGDTGYFFVLDCEAGRYLRHLHRASRQGRRRRAWTGATSEGREFIKEILQSGQGIARV